MTTIIESLKSSRIVLVDDSLRHLTKYAESLWEAGYDCCVPAFTLPRFHFGPEDYTPSDILLRVLRDEIKNTFSGLTVQERDAYEKRIVPINFSDIWNFCFDAKPQLIILDTSFRTVPKYDDVPPARGYDESLSLKERIPNVKIIGMSTNPNYFREWANVDADAFYDKNRSLCHLPLLVDQVLRGDLNAKETLEERMAGR